MAKGKAQTKDSSKKLNKGSAASHGSAPQPAGKSDSSTIRWPDLPFAGRELTLDVLIPDQVLLLPNLFTPKDCARWIAFLDANLQLDPSPTVPKRGEAVRSNERFSVQDADLAGKLFDLLRPYIAGLASRPPGSDPKALSKVTLKHCLPAF